MGCYAFMFLPAGCIALWAAPGGQLVGYDSSDTVTLVAGRISLLDQTQLPWCAGNQQTHPFVNPANLLWDSVCSYVGQVRSFQSTPKTSGAVDHHDHHDHHDDVGGHNGWLFGKNVCIPRKRICCVASLSGLLPPARAHNLAPSFPLYLLSLDCLLDFHSLGTPFFNMSSPSITRAYLHAHRHSRHKYTHVLTRTILCPSPGLDCKYFTCYFTCYFKFALHIHSFYHHFNTSQPVEQHKRGSLGIPSRPHIIVA